ncbi:ORF0 [Fowl aviadenovirus C]|uniref:ORF0 n=4 Tax=Fowl aviadenovirus C TaxID=190063 RepID=F2VJF5_9ADEN|nr:ORF0 [Fowl aviadenovirus C]YP_010792007.1 ORF0 [Fowl aviadenovirus C]ABB18330.1 ORF0 [Fowl aviadenovirus 4]ABB18343.1 ORF0 [Fowl aviadenovirus 10]UVW56760.1 ORF0 [Fowl adenovirus]ADQ39042.1 ORF0 [Fowl aviadenovirus C]AIS19774.1 ORF0 [Fowl aviadenovirus C]
MSYRRTVPLTRCALLDAENADIAISEPCHNFEIQFHPITPRRVFLHCFEPNRFWTEILWNGTVKQSELNAALEKIVELL